MKTYEYEIKITGLGILIFGEPRERLEVTRTIPAKDFGDACKKLFDAEKEIKIIDSFEVLSVSSLNILVSK